MRRTKIEGDLHRIEAYHTVRTVPDFTNLTVKTGVIYVGGNVADGTTAVTFLCPCGCGEIVYLPIFKSAGWDADYQTSENTISLSPSISHRDGCKSHYFIKKNKVQWA